MGMTPLPFHVILGTSLRVILSAAKNLGASLSVNSAKNLGLPWAEGMGIPETLRLAQGDSMSRGGLSRQ